MRPLITQNEQSPFYYASTKDSSAECPRTDAYLYFKYEQSPYLNSLAECPRTDEPCLEFSVFLGCVK